MCKFWEKLLGGPALLTAEENSRVGWPGRQPSEMLPAMLLLWISLITAWARAAPAPGSEGPTLRAARAPNVVLVASDSFDGRLTFHPGSQVVKLPSINFMKTLGTSFLNAYTNSPICCPSRSAMWSGLFTHLTQSWNNFKGLDPNYTTWMDIMEKHGYRTQKFGKLDYTSGHHSVRLHMMLSSGTRIIHLCVLVLGNKLWHIENLVWFGVVWFCVAILGTEPGYTCFFWPGAKRLMVVLPTKMPLTKFMRKLFIYVPRILVPSKELAVDELQKPYILQSVTSVE